MQLALAIDDAIPLGSEGPLEREARIEALAVLFEVDDAQAVGSIDRAGIGLQLADDHPQESRLARTVRAEHAKAHAGREKQIEVIDDGPSPQPFAEAAADPEALRLSFRGGEINSAAGDGAACAALAQLLDQLPCRLD